MEQLTNTFEVGIPVEQAWAVLTDLERIAPCMPGAQLQEIEGDEFRGVVKVKVGAITAQYKGKASFTEMDATAHRAVLEASGRDTRGAGNATAVITAQLTPSDAGTHVSVITDLTVTGKVAQFGRGIMADISAKLLAQFVDNLESMILAGEPEPEPEPAVAEAVAEGPAETREDPPTVRVIDAPEATPVDLLDAAGSSVLKRLVPVLVLLGAVIVVLGLRRRHR